MTDIHKFIYRIIQWTCRARKIVRLYPVTEHTARHLQCLLSR